MLNGDENFFPNNYIELCGGELWWLLETKAWHEHKSVSLFASYHPLHLHWQIVHYFVQHFVH